MIKICISKFFLEFLKISFTEWPPKENNSTLFFLSFFSIEISSRTFFEFVCFKNLLTKIGFYVKASQGNHSNCMAENISANIQKCQ